MGRMDGKVAVVTGGAGGIGAATSPSLAAEGAAVVVADVAEESGAEVVRKIAAEGGSARFHRLDVTVETSWTDMVEGALAEQGRLDVLVNNAGITDTRGLADTTAESWERMIAIDQLGVMLGMKHVAGAMKAGGGGSIVNISSIAGLVAMPRSSVAYAAAKGAVRVHDEMGRGRPREGRHPRQLRASRSRRD